MAPKSRKNRGKTVKLTDFTDDYIPEDAYDWAEQPELNSKEAQEAKIAEKIAKQRVEYSRTANNTLNQAESFRTAQHTTRGSDGSINDLQKPYVAHFGNLRNGITADEFLELFNRDAVANHWLINREGKTFAFVEFATAQAMVIALLLDGTFQRGRRLYVDLATPSQVERLFHADDKSGFSRDEAGQVQPGGLAAMDISRDAFGGPQPERSLGMPSRGDSRSNFGSRQDFGDLSRDILGSAVQSGSPLAASPNSPSPNLASWRDEGPVVQPEFRDARESRGMSRVASRGDQWMNNASGAASPLGNWRDEPPTEAPTFGGAEANAARGGARGRGGRNSRGSSDRFGSPKSPPSGERWAELRR